MERRSEPSAHRSKPERELLRVAGAVGVGALGALALASPSFAIVVCKYGCGFTAVPRTCTS